MSDSIDDDPRRAVGALLAAGYTDSFRALHPAKPGYTYPTEHPWLRLDYIFSSQCLTPRLQSSGIVDDDVAHAASDHLPVWATFR
jgi:exonuclease III